MTPTNLGVCSFITFAPCERQPYIVVRHREVRAAPYRLKEFRQDFIAVCTLAPKQQPQHIVCFCAVLLRSQRSANTCDCCIPIGRRTRRRGDIEPGLELRQRFIEIARAEINSSEVDVYGGEGWGKSDRAVPGPSCALSFARFPPSGSPKGVTTAPRPLKPTSLFPL